MEVVFPHIKTFGLQDETIASAQKDKSRSEERVDHLAVAMICHTYPKNLQKKILQSLLEYSSLLRISINQNIQSEDDMSYEITDIKKI